MPMRATSNPRRGQPLRPPRRPPRRVRDRLVAAGRGALLRIADRGTRFAPVTEDLIATSAGDAWLISLHPLDPVERAELGTFRVALDGDLLAEAQRLNAALTALDADAPVGSGDLAVVAEAGGTRRTVFVPSTSAAPEAAAQPGWASDLARWHSRVRALARSAPWSTLACLPSTRRSPATA